MVSPIMKQLSSDKILSTYYFHRIIEQPSVERKVELVISSVAKIYRSTIKAYNIDDG